MFSERQTWGACRDEVMRTEMRQKCVVTLPGRNIRTGSQSLALHDATGSDKSGKGQLLFIICNSLCVLSFLNIPG